MGFFLKEDFVLPGGNFQEGVETALAGSGSISQDGTYGYIRTYADADGAIIVPDEGLTPGEFADKPISWQISYQLATLPASDVIRVLHISQSATQPAPGTAGTLRLTCYLFNNAGTYQEGWYYTDSAGNSFYYNGATNAWQAGSATVRNINLATTYTLTVTWNPVTKTFSITHDGSESATTTAVQQNTNDWWWWIGDGEVASYYGQLRLDYIYVEAVGGLASDLSIQNGLLTDGLVSGYFDGGDLPIQNALLTDTLDGLDLFNEISIYDTQLDGIGIQNRIGKRVTRKTKLSSQILIDGIDVTKKLVDCLITDDEGSATNSISLSIRKMPELRARKKDEAGYSTPRIAVFIDGHPEGTYFIESVKPSVSFGKHVMTIEGRSETAVLDRPFAAQSSYQWPTATLRSAIIEEVVNGAVPIIFGIGDGLVPGRMYSAKDMSPLEIIQDIVDATGGDIATDNEGNLIIYHKPFSTVGAVPVLGISSSDVTQLTCDPTVPDGTNSQKVSQYDKGSGSTIYSSLSISSDKDTVKSDGIDFATITVDVVDEYGRSPDFELIENEEVNTTDDNSGPHKLTVSRSIPHSANETPWGGEQRGGVLGVWTDEAHTTQIDGPYTWDGNVITVGGTITNSTTYYVSYWTTEAIGWVVSGDGSLVNEEKQGDATIYWEDFLSEGRVVKKLMAQQGASGYIEVYATYGGQESDKIKIAVDDPRIGAVELYANPSNVARGEKDSEIKACVTGPDGLVVENGLTVNFAIQTGQGSLSANSAVTGNETIEEDCFCLTRERVPTQHPIATVEYVYLYNNGLVDPKIDYSGGGEIDGAGIILVTPLPFCPCWVRVRYTTGGIAKITYTSPAISYDGTPQIAMKVGIVGKCGGKVGYCEVDLGGTSSSVSGVKPAYTPWHYVDFPQGGGEGLFRGSEAKPTYTEQKQIITFGNYAEIEYLQSDNCEFSKITGADFIIVRCTVQGAVIANGENNYGVEFVSGSRQVLNRKTNAPVEGVAVSIAWSPTDTENTTTDSSGYFSFQRGVKGDTKITFTKTGYITSEQTLSIGEGSIGTTEPGYVWADTPWKGRIRYRVRTSK